REIDIAGLAVKAHRNPAFGFDPRELLEEVDVKIGAAKLAVGDSLQTEVFLEANDVANRHVFDGAQLGAVDRAVAVSLASVEQCRRAQEAADVVGAKRGCAAETHRDSSKAYAGAVGRRMRAVAGKAFIMREQVEAGDASRRPVQD